MKTEEEISPGVKIKRGHISIILLAIILLLGFYLRTYHIDYPVVGYHNWKETHYLTEARNFAEEGFFRYGFFIPSKNYPVFRGDPSGAHADTFPIISILCAVGFMIFGQELWVARLIGILFNVGAIASMYLLIKTLYEREDLALVTAFLTATLPLFIFFSHNVQLINPGVFFMITSAYFYVKWRKNFQGSDIILASVFLTLAAVTKYSFGIILLPMLLTFPYKKIGELKKYKKELCIAFLIFLLFPVWHIYANYLIPEEYRIEKQAGLHQIQPEKVLQLNWTAIRSFIDDNYTMGGFYIAIIGLFLVIFMFYKKRDLAEGFTLAYAFSIIPFTVLMASKLSGHNYHQYPIAPVVIILMAYVIVKAGDPIKRIRIENLDIRHMNIIIIAIICLTYPVMNQASISRQFDTQFPGLDIAGDYIKDHSKDNDRMFFSGHQTYGILWHSDRKGYPIMIPTPDDFKYAEENNLNVTWIFIYQWGFELLQKDEHNNYLHEEEWSYIKDRFSLKQIAFQQTPNGPRMLYFLMEKGGSFDESKVNEMLKDKEVKTRTYENTREEYEIGYINLELR